MRAAELFQLPIVKGLRAKAGAMYSQPAEFAQLFTRQFRVLFVGWLNCIPLRSLGDLCVSAVSVFDRYVTAETQRTRRWRRDKTRWIHLHRYFRAIDDLEAFMNTFQDPFDLRRLQKERRA